MWSILQQLYLLLEAPLCKLASEGEKKASEDC